MGRSIGMAFGDGEVQAAVLTGSLRSPRFRGLISMPAPEPGSPASPDESRPPSGKAYLALPAAMVTLRKTSIPVADRAQIARTVKFQAERLIPNISPEEVAVDFCVLDEGKEHAEILLVVARKADIAACVERTGLDPSSVRGATVDFAALFNVLSAGGCFSGAAVAAAVVFGAGGHRVLLARDGRLAGARLLPDGGPEGLEGRLAAEIRHGLLAADLGPRPDRIVIAGPAPDGLADALGRSLGGGALVFDPRGRFGAGRSGIPPEALVPMGAALEGLGATPVRLDLLREEPRVVTGYEAARRPAFLLAAMLIVFLAAELLGTIGASSRAGADLDRLENHARALFSRVIPYGKRKFSPSFPRDIEKAAKLKAAAGSAGEEWSSFLEFLRVLCEQLPGGEATVIQSIAFKGQKATIRGEARDVDAFEGLAKGLEKSGRFQVRTPFRIRSGREGPSRLAFTIELTPRGK